eukprot:scaffold130792_cov44-Tisochrysis_lutea.AAC.1
MCDDDWNRGHRARLRTPQVHQLYPAAYRRHDIYTASCGLHDFFWRAWICSLTPFCSSFCGATKSGVPAIVRRSQTSMQTDDVILHQQHFWMTWERGMRTLALSVFSMRFMSALMYSMRLLTLDFTSTSSCTRICRSCPRLVILGSMALCHRVNKRQALYARCPKGKEADVSCQDSSQTVEQGACAAA